MGSRLFEAPAFLSLLLFLGINYLCGYQLGMLLTRSPAISVAVALAMPLVSLVGLSLVRAKAGEPGAQPDA